MRLGAQAVEIAEGTRTHETYGEPVVHERHRHRYEVNNHYRQQIVDAGLVISGTFQEGRLVEIVELPDHPVVRRQPVPPGVQVAADQARAALPRVRRRRARPRPRATGRHRRDAADLASPRDGRARPLPRPRRHADASGRGAAGRRPRHRGAARPRARGRRGRRRRGDRLEHRQPVRRLEPTAAGTPLFLCSHMDTVPPTGPIEPVVEDGVVRNSGGTILGADNKSAVVAMVETARRVVEERVPHAGLELAVHAEGGGRPARRRRRSTARGSPPGWATSTTRPGRSAR